LGRAGRGWRAWFGERRLVVYRRRNLEARRLALLWTGFSGKLALILVALLFVSGAAMTLYYSPAPGAAYDSVDYAQFQLPFGGVVRGVHAYAWNLLLVVLGVHLARAFVVGAYKAPWQRAWVSAVLVLLLLPAFLVTGDLLPWNQSGYWSTRVRLGIISSVPVVGDFLAGFLRGGPNIGIVALTRFYALHILLLPCALVVLLAVHLYFIRQGVLTAPLSGNPSARNAVPALLDTAARLLVLFVVAALVLGVLAWQSPVPLGDPADPTDTSYLPRPEWWALFLNQLVTIFSGRLAVVGTVLIPGGLVALLIALPFIDRLPERHPARRKKTMLAAAAVAAVWLGVSVIGYVKYYVSAP